MDIAKEFGHDGIVSDIVNAIPWQKALAWQRVKNFVVFLQRGGYSAADWNVGLHVGAKTSVSGIKISGAGSIPTAARSIGRAAVAVVAATGTIARQNIATQNRVLDNLDLCRIISSFIP
eukprot:gene33335-43098_t